MYQTSSSPSYHSYDLGISSYFYSYGNYRSRHRSHTRKYSSYNHGELNIGHPRFPQEAVPRGLQGENWHQNHPYYSYPSISLYPNPSMPQHIYHNIPPHTYTSIPPQPNFLWPFFFSTPICEPYVFPHYPHIPSLGYIYT